MVAAETAWGGLQRGVGPGAEQASLGRQEHRGMPGPGGPTSPPQCPQQPLRRPEGPGPQLRSPACRWSSSSWALLPLDLKIQEPQWGPENRLGSPAWCWGWGLSAHGRASGSPEGPAHGARGRVVVLAGSGVWLGCEKVALNSPGGRTGLRGEIDAGRGEGCPACQATPAPPGGMVPREPWSRGADPGRGWSRPSAPEGRVRGT